MQLAAETQAAVDEAAAPTEEQQRAASDAYQVARDHGAKPYEIQAAIDEQRRTT